MKHKLFTISFLLTVVLFIIFGFAMLGISILPFEIVKVRIDALAHDGNATPFTVVFFRKTVVNLRFLGIALLFVSGLLFMCRRQIKKHIFNILDTFFSSSKELIQHITETVRKEEKIHLYALFIILLSAIVIRLCFLFQPMRYDEATTFIDYASKPLYFGLSYYSAPNNHLFHTFLVHIACMFFGNQPWVIRLPAFIAGILLIPAVYMATRIFYNKEAALLTAGLVASSSILTEYSTNARGYTLICLIFLLILALAPYLKQNRNPSLWLLFAILSALGFYAIPIMLYPFGIVVVWIFVSIIFQNTKFCYSFPLKNLFIYLLVVGLLTFTLYVPVFVVSGFKSVVANSKLISYKLSWSYFSRFILCLPSVWNQWNRDIPITISLFLVIGFFASLVFHNRLTSYRIPIVLPAAIWLVFIIIIKRVIPPDRVWLFLLPLYIALASSGVSYIFGQIVLTNRYKHSIFVVLVITLSIYLGLNVVRTKSIYYSKETGSLTDAESITMFLKEYLRPGDRVLARYTPLTYYFYLHDVPVKYLMLDLNFTNRILVVVNKSYHQTLRGILGDIKFLSYTKLGTARVIKSYKSATLYEIGKNK